MADTIQTSEVQEVPATPEAEVAPQGVDLAGPEEPELAR